MALRLLELGPTGLLLAPVGQSDRAQAWGVLLVGKEKKGRECDWDGTQDCNNPLLVRAKECQENLRASSMPRKTEREALGFCADWLLREEEVSEKTGPTALPGPGKEARCSEASGSHHNRAEMAKSHNTRRRQRQQRAQRCGTAMLQTQQASILSNRQVSSCCVHS